MKVARRMSVSPWVVVASLLIGLVGVILAVVFYFASQSERELVYAANPIPTTVVAAGQATELEVLHRGKPIGGQEVTAAQIAIWNAGKESIRPENVLEDVIIFTEPPVPILEASVRTRSRAVTAFTLVETPEWSEGKMPISWRILEQDDGASVQLIYAGASGVHIGVKGTVEGLRPIEELRLSQTVWYYGLIVGAG